MEKSNLIWLNGEFVNWEDANISVMSHTLHYGTGVFEGIRARDSKMHLTAIPENFIRDPKNNYI